jgi:hypothetical protein
VTTPSRKLAKAFSRRVDAIAKKHPHVFVEVALADPKIKDMLRAFVEDVLKQRSKAAVKKLRSRKKK